MRVLCLCIKLDTIISMPPHTKKVLSELMHAPHITSQSTLYETIRSMMDMRLYELPVVNTKNTILGIVTIDTILNKIIHDDMISNYLIEFVTIQKPVTRLHEGTVKEIFHLLRDKNISRIILTNSRRRLTGIISRSDIQKAFLRPSDRQRHRGTAEDSRSALFDSDETYREDDPIERFSQKNVFTLRDNSSKIEIIKQLVNSSYNSVVLVDLLDRPTGFLSLHDIVRCLATFEADIETPIIFKKPDESVTPAQLEKVRKRIEHMVKKLSKIQRIEKVEIAVKEQKYPTQKVAQFQTRVLISMKGQDVRITATNKEYVHSIQNALSTAEQQFIKHTKYTYHKTQATPA